MSRDYFEKYIREIIDRIVREVSREVPRMIETAIPSIISPFGIIYGDFRRPYSETYTTDEEVITIIEMPGVLKETIDLKVGRDVLEVEGRFSEELINQASRYSLFKVKGYRKTIVLPKKVRGEDAKAVYRDGILIVKAPIEKPKGVEIKVE
ncbi:MAG: Hsp20/alpha crystallin family protein [Aigarchaeota archaeon]|nr:Hsp20/alpha crystallin family protein [Aigarchaeota archaeon]MCX8193379.1 Hsp20/alpha crystallin family protein [Nitrososphaeria archaeon]MDW7985909.1 Hsp20/alpha crystallin family protein [Nitrososphaerota archaeon]